MNKKTPPPAGPARPARRAKTEPHEAGPSQEFRPMMAELYRRAETHLRKQPRGHPRKGPTPQTAADTRRLVHELQVHQVELELQNTELQTTRNAAETALEKYTDLFDFAPVGYFSLDEDGRILEVNLTGAALLGVERSQLLQRRLPRFLPVTSLPIFRAFLERVFTGTAPQLCEAPLLKADGAKFWANFHGSRAAAAAGLPQWCRVAVSDITPLKEAEEAQHQVEALTASNLELQQEIVRRQTVEASFQTSQQQQAQLLAESREMHEQMRHLSHQILQAQEDERKRISRELHDDITQTLVGINVHLTALAQEATVNPATLKQKIVQTQRLVEKSVEMVHQFARELRPTSLDDLGLIATLHSFMKDFLKRTGIRVQFTTFAEVDQVDSARRTVIYRVVQSALANVAQHARASRVKVSLCKLADGVHLEITDNGRAFQVDRVLKAKKYKRLGLLGMRERVEMVGGKLAIESTRGQGTTIRAQIPFGEFLPPRPALMEPAKGKP